MITEQALNEAIAEVQGKRDPNRQDCMMLAAFYIIQDRLYPSETQESGYSFAAPTEARTDDYSGLVGEYGDTDFLQTIRGMDAQDAWLVMDELMSTLQAINPRLYNGVLRQLNQ